MGPFLRFESFWNFPRLKDRERGKLEERKGGGAGGGGKWKGAVQKRRKYERTIEERRRNKSKARQGMAKQS